MFASASHFLSHGTTSPQEFVKCLLAMASDGFFHGSAANFVEKAEMDLRNECNLAGLADTSAIRGVIGHLKIHFSVSSLVAWYNLSPGEFKHASEG